MLGTTLWLVVTLGLLSAVLLDAAASFGRAGVHAAADHAIELAMNDAVADYQNRLRSAIAQSASAPAGTSSSTPVAIDYASAVASLPNPLTGTDVSAAADGPRLTVAYAVVPTTITAPSCPSAGSVSGGGTATGGASVTGDGPDAVAWLQCSAFVGESRMSLRVTVRVPDASGAAVLARRDQYVTLRLFAEPPYSAVSGRKDASAADPLRADALGAPAHEGDTGGDTVSGAPAAGLASPWPAGGTLIHVRYECRDGAGSCANAAPPDPDAGLRAGARWTNGNRPSP